MEAKDILSYLGIDADNIDAFKEKYNKEYIKRSAAAEDDELKTKIVGKFAGSVLTSAKRLAKSANIELQKEVLENKKVEEILDFIGENFSTTLDSVKGEYEGKLKATETDAVKEWKEKYEKIESKNKDNDNMLKTLKQQLADTENQYKSKIKDFQIGSVKKSAWDKIKFASTVDDMKRKGFEAHINDMYELDLDENETPFVKDKKSGQRIANPSKAGEFMTIEEVLLQEAEKNNLIQKNNANQNNAIFAGSGTPPVFNAGNTPTTNDLRALPASQRK